MADTSQPMQPRFPGDALLNRFFLTPEQKADWEEGKKIVKNFYSVQTASGSNLNFFRARNARNIETLLWCKGSQDIREFLGYMSISDANKAFLSIDTTQSRMTPQFMATLVESMSKNKLYPCVKAIDDGSMTQKEQRMFEAIYRMNEARTIAALQQKSGVQVEPTNAFVPDDELSAKVYFQLQDRLPKEIKFEELISKIMVDIGFQKTLNRKTIYDRVAINYAATKVESLGEGEYTVRRCIPTNMLYNFFMNDNGEMEVSLIGEFTNVKVRDFRKKFAKSASNPKGLSEKDIFELAKLSAHVNIGTFNYMWNENWAYYSQFNSTRPYDDSNILVLDCEVDFGEDMYFVEKTDSYGKPQIQKKNGIPFTNRKKDGTYEEQPIPDNVKINRRQKNTWMRGVYAPFGDKMLYWGPTDIIIQDYTNVYKSHSSYTIVISNNDGEFVPSLIERAMASFRDYQLLELKRRQIIALVEPDGFRIDVENIRNIDLGDGNSISWEQVLRIKLQSGIELYSSKGIDPLAHEAPPISAGTQSTNLSKIIELTNAMVAIANEIRERLGVPRYRDGADVGDRTAGSLAEGQNTSSYNVTGFVDNDNKELWEKTFQKVCLLKWNDVVKTEPESTDDLLNTRFLISLEMKATDFEKQQLEQDIQRYSQMPDAQGNPSISPKDAMMLREIGEGNYKLAAWYLTHVFDSNRARAIQESQLLQQQNAAEQQQVASQGQQADAAQQQAKMASEKEMISFKASKDQELAVIQMYSAVAAKTGIVDPVFKAFLPALVQNVEMPIEQENKIMGQVVAAAAANQAAPTQQGDNAASPQPTGQPIPPGPPSNQQIQPTQSTSLQ